KALWNLVVHGKCRGLIPSWEGLKPKASGWVFASGEPTRALRDRRRCAPPLPRGDFQASCRISCKIQVLRRKAINLEWSRETAAHYEKPILFVDGVSSPNVRCRPNEAGVNRS